MKFFQSLFPFFLIMVVILGSCQKEEEVTLSPTNVVNNDSLLLGDTLLDSIIKNDCFPLTDTLTSVDSSMCVCTPLPPGIGSGSLRCPQRIVVTSCSPRPINAYLQVKNDPSPVFGPLSFEYCSYDPTIIRVDRAGMVTGIQAGITTVTVCLGIQTREVIVQVIP